jgi:hypothetical protein
MDEDMNARIRDHEVQTEDWHFSKLADHLYTWFHRFNEEFFDSELQHAAISFQKRGVNNLGHYVIGRNAFGLKWNINLNRLHAGRSLMMDLATLLHEMIHQEEEGFGKRQQRGNYHSARFRRKAKLLGIPCNQNGVFLDCQDPFLSLLREYGVDMENRDNWFSEAMVESERGLGSKLKKWSCGCTNVRVAIDDFRAICLKCHNEFVLDKNTRGENLFPLAFRRVIEKASQPD